MGITRSVALAALIVAVPLRAHAGDKAAWTAAKANLSKDTTVLIGLDLTQLTKSSLFNLAFPMVLAQQGGDAKAGLDLVKKHCNLDPLKVVSSVVVGTDDDQKHGALFISLNGVDQPKIVSCMEAVAKAQGNDVKVVATTEGKITELAMGDKKIYLTWIGTGVIVLPLDFANKADLTAWTAKGLAKSKVAKGMNKVNTGHAVWAVSAVPKDIDDKTKMKMGYGSMAMANATLSADLHVQLGSAADAKAAAERSQKDLAAMAQNPGLDAKLQKLLTGITVAAASDEVQIKGSIPESEVLSLVMALKP